MQRLEDILDHGYAGTTLDPQIVTRHPRIPWRQIADIGNVMRHEYGRVDLHLIWETVCGSELAALLAAIELEHSASST